MSKAEDLLEFQLKTLQIKGLEREHRFHVERRWRFDFAYPNLKIAIEVEGVTRYGRNRDGSMKLGRHQTAKGYANDCEKYNAAAELGWRVFRFPQTEIKTGRAFNQIERVINATKSEV